MKSLNSEKVLLFPRNSVICLKNWKLWWAATAIEFNIFWWKFSCVSYSTMSTKGCSGTFLFCLSWVIDKPGFCECVQGSGFVIFTNKSRSKQNKKNLEHAFVDIGKYENVCKISTKNIEFYGSWISSKFNFSDKTPCFLKTLELCLNFCMGFWINLLVLLNYEKFIA